MKTIFRYPLAVTDVQTIEIPRLSKILTAQFKNDILCMWAEIDTDLPLEPVLIEIIGTGHNMPDTPPGIERRYIATAQNDVNGFGLVWHLYHLCEKRES